MDIEEHAQLVKWLQSRSLIDDNAPKCENLAGGVSNKTVLVTSSSGSVVVKQALSELRVATTWTCSPERIHREGLGLRVLRSVLPPDTTPRWLAEDKADHILVMSAIPEPHANWKSRLLQGQCETDQIDQFAVLLAAIHTAHITEAMAPFHDTRFFEDLRLAPYYEYTASRVAEATEFLNNLAEETRGKTGHLVHGDYSPKNVLIHKGRLILLDHEVMHIGDPAFDIGFAMTHLLSKAHHLPPYREMFVKAAHRFWSRYASQTVPDRELAARAARHTLACLLARVSGRSPLEYLSAEEQQRQKTVCLELMHVSAVTRMDVTMVIERFIAGLGGTS
ncbi:MAG: phosphotransferase [Pseudomonadota bacterium]